MSAPFDDAFAGCLRGRSSDFHELLKRIVKMNWISHSHLPTDSYSFYFAPDKKAGLIAWL